MKRTIARTLIFLLVLTVAVIAPPLAPNADGVSAATTWTETPAPTTTKVTSSTTTVAPVSGSYHVVIAGDAM